MRVMIGGIDGYIGWALALHLVSKGHEVSGIDNFYTRKRVKEVGSWSATPISTMAKRVEAVKKLTGRKINFIKGNLTDYDTVKKIDTEVQT